MIISILEPLPTLIVTTPSTSLCLFCNSCFELLILATEQVSITCKVHINNLYIKYTLVHLAILLIHKIFKALPLLVTISFAVEALCFRLGFSFGLLQGSGNLLAILLEVPFFPLPFYLKLVVLSTINICCFFLISTFVVFSITKSSGIVFIIP